MAFPNLFVSPFITSRFICTYALKRSTYIQSCASAYDSLSTFLWMGFFSINLNTGFQWSMCTLLHWYWLVFMILWLHSSQYEFVCAVCCWRFLTIPWILKSQVSLSGFRLKLSMLFLLRWQGCQRPSRVSQVMETSGAAVCWLSVVHLTPPSLSASPPGPMQPLSVHLAASSFTLKRPEEELSGKWQRVASLLKGRDNNGFYMSDR